MCFCACVFYRAALPLLIVCRSQVVFEVKPWEAEADLKGLFDKIREVCPSVSNFVLGMAVPVLEACMQIGRCMIKQNGAPLETCSGGVLLGMYARGICVLYLSFPAR